MTAESTSFPTLDVLDADGAVRETLDAIAVDGDTRADFLKKTALGGGALIGTASVLGAVPTMASASHYSLKNDLAILNFALTLEYLEAAFYAEAVLKTRLRGKVLNFAKTVKRHEAEHVTALRATIRKLGGRPVASPRFNFQGSNRTVAKFLATATVLEDTGVRAYQGQAANIQSTAVLAAAGSILAVEARHAAWVRAIREPEAGERGSYPAPRAFSKPATKAQILKAVGATGFIVG